MKNPPHRPRKDEEAGKVDQLKKSLSWRQIAIELNRGKADKDQLTPDGYRSLWRARHSHGEK